MLAFWLALGLMGKQAESPSNGGGGGGSAPIWPINPQQHLQALREREEAMLIQRNNEALIALLV